MNKNIKRHQGELCLVSHNADKLCLVNLAVLVEIKFVNHHLSVDTGSSKIK